MTALPLYLEVGSVARRAGVTPAAVHNWITAGKLVADARTVGGIYLFTVDTYEAFMRERATWRKAWNADHRDPGDEHRDPR